ncbi:MAG: YicC/YloC family endoribonuclease [Bacteroidia bacterium]
MNLNLCIFTILAAMIKSMTGFGKCQVSLDSRIITIDIRALNSKQLDLNLRIPSILREQEGEIRALIGERMERGKIDMQISLKNTGNQALTEINTDLIKEQFNRLKSLQTDLGISSDTLFTEVMRLPDSVVEAEQKLEESELEGIYNAIRTAVENTDIFRKDEGIGLEKELLFRVEEIEKRLVEIAGLEGERIETVKTRIRSKIDELLQQNNGSENRFEEEMIYFLEKLDISEEKQRLATHCSYFRTTLGETNSNGRKLGFISQEMGREINTIGSKSNHAGMQKLVVLMKDELEKIKEQLNNVL